MRPAMPAGRLVPYSAETLGYPGPTRRYAPPLAAAEPAYQPTQHDRVVAVESPNAGAAQVGLPPPHMQWGGHDAPGKQQPAVPAPQG